MIWFSPVSKLPALNLDVVTQIMGYSKCGTISEIMKACRAYYSIGVPILLRRPVEISSSEFLSSFYYFIFATNLGPTDRARFLRTIIWDHDVDIPRDDRNDYYDRGISPTAYTRKQYEQDRGDALKFMYILSHASGLEYLDFTQGSSQQFIEFCPDAVDTLANLARLRSLHICHGTTTDVNWFLRAKSPIVALAIDFRGHASDNQELSTFSRFRDTLVSLEIWDLMLRPGDENLRFPRVRRFRIEANYGQLPIPASYVFQIFPNIQVLELPSHFEDATYGDYNESNIQNQRSLNLAQVRKLEPAQRNLHLKELRGCAADLFRGAYECTVENLSVVRLDCWDFQWFLPLLPQMRPVSLLLQFNVCDREPGPIQIVEMALQKLSTTNTLENLSLFIDLPGPQDASSIHWCKVSHLQVEFRTYSIT